MFEKVNAGHPDKMADRVPVYDTMPEGWKERWGAQTAPSGYVWIYNRKSILSKEYRHGLLKIKEL